MLSPWVIRNYEVFHRFVFLRDDFGLQLRLGNGPYADGMLMAYLQPNLNKLELEKFQSMANSPTPNPASARRSIGSRRIPNASRSSA